MKSDMFFKHRKLIILFILVIVFGFIVLQIIESRKFHVVSTNPNANSISVISPFLIINFNKQLSPSGLSINRSGGLITSYRVQNKSIVLDLNTPMAENQKYSISVLGVDDKTGDRLKNLSISFVPQNISFQNLSKDQQTAILKNQTGYKNPVNSVVYSGTESLINKGVSTAQINNLETYFLEYKSSAKNIVINPNGIEVYNNSSASSISFSIDFNVSIDGVVYKAVGTYSNISSISLVLYNPQTNNAVFSSNS